MRKPDTPGRRVLRILFEEILEIIPEERAQKLIDGHREGRTIDLQEESSLWTCFGLTPSPY
jgi:hypothetical protein